MNDREAWVRFACAALASSKPTEAASKIADEMLAEMDKRGLDASPAQVELVSDEGDTPAVIVEFAGVNTTDAGELRVVGCVDVSQ